MAYFVIQTIQQLQNSIQNEAEWKYFASRHTKTSGNGQIL